LARLLVLLLLSLAPGVARAETCSHFDLFPGEGVDVALVSALRERMTRSGIASSGDLEDCPVRLAASGDDVDVTIELEDRVVNRSFAREPPREAAWAIALLLEELAGAEGAPRTQTGPPEEIIPTVEMPSASPEPVPTPHVEETIPPPPRPFVRLGAGLRALEAVQYEGQNATVERAAVSLDAGFLLPPLPERIRVLASVEWYVPTGVPYAVIQSLQPGVGFGVEAVSLRRFTIWADALFIPFRMQWLDSRPLTRGPGAAARARFEWRLFRSVGVAIDLAAVWMPYVRAIGCRDKCDRKERDIYTAPWDVGLGLDFLFHL
jgi:hypothetical protein